MARFVPVSIELKSKGLDVLPDIASNVTYLTCGWNRLTSIRHLPPELTGLESSHNQLVFICELPERLWNMDLSHNVLSHIPKLPRGLKYLILNGNDLLEIPELPPTLSSLSCAHNPKLTRLPNFPPEMTFLSCGGSPIKHIPELPRKMKSVYLGSPHTIPPIPKNVEMLVLSMDKLDERSFKHVFDHLPRLAAKSFAGNPYRGTVLEEILRCTQYGHRMRILKYMYDSPYFDKGLVMERKVKTFAIWRNLRQLPIHDAISHVKSFVF